MIVNMAVVVIVVAVAANDALTTSFIEEAGNDTFKPVYLSW